MKTTIYELLGMIKDNKSPKIILFKNLQWTYDKRQKDYENMFNEWLFDVYVITDILNDEVEILETTITYKPDKIEKIDINDFLNKDLYTRTDILAVVINEIIDKVNNL